MPESVDFKESSLRELVFRRHELLPSASGFSHAVPCERVNIRVKGEKETHKAFVRVEVERFDVVVIGVLKWQREGSELRRRYRDTVKTR